MSLRATLNFPNLLIEYSYTLLIKYLDSPISDEVDVSIKVLC